MKNQHILSCIRSVLKDDSISIVESVQTLWSGYGEILRVKSLNTDQTFIVKTISQRSQSSHPRGWNSATSHQRKLYSYQVETHFYQQYAALTNYHCRVPNFIGYQIIQDGMLLVMEDLDSLGYSLRPTTFSSSSIEPMIYWLANFHAVFLGHKGDQLWETGTYWHLSTRLDELNKMPDGKWKKGAHIIDAALQDANYQTLVHGDTKPANFCFHNKSTKVAAVDFQYVGKGTGVKDLAYLVCSALTDKQANLYGDRVLDIYIQALKESLNNIGSKVDKEKLELEIRNLYPIAFADFYRFLLGWNPDSAKISHYLIAMAEKGLKLINSP